MQQPRKGVIFYVDSIGASLVVWVIGGLVALLGKLQDKFYFDKTKSKLTSQRVKMRF